MLKEAIVSAALACCAMNTYAIKWIPLSKPSEKIQIYVDNDSMQFANGVARFWTRTEYVPPEKQDDGTGGVRYLQKVMIRWIYKCADEQAAYSTLTMNYTNGHTATLHNGEFTDLQPGSTMLFAGIVACAKGEAGDLPHS